MPGLLTREAVLLLGGLVVLIGAAFVAGRVLRSRRHGFSIRLQLFFAIATTSVLACGVIALWVIDRLRTRADELAVSSGPPLEVVAELVREFGPKISLLVALLGVGAAGAAWALGRGVAGPLERGTHPIDQPLQQLPGRSRGVAVQVEAVAVEAVSGRFPVGGLERERRQRLHRVAAAVLLQRGHHAAADQRGERDRLGDGGGHVGHPDLDGGEVA